MLQLVHGEHARKYVFITLPSVDITPTVNVRLRGLLKY